MNLPFLFARRYLFSKKTHNAINVVSMVSVFGVTVAVAALVCTLSVFNGFQHLLGGLYSSFDPELKIKVIEGKVFNTNTAAFEDIRNHSSVEHYCETLEENALIVYKQAQTSAVVKGVPDNYNKLTEIDKLIYAGSFKLKEYDFNYSTVGAGLASALGTGNSFIDPITINVPVRTGKINLTNPASSYKSKNILIGGTFGINQPEYDNNYIIVPISFARELFEYETEVSSVEIKLKKGSNKDQIKKQFRKILGEKYTVQDVMEQKADFYRINSIEKWMTFLILSFILIVALFNVVGSLSMLILEKYKDAMTLSKLGADLKLIRKIFIFEGWLIAFSGAILGIILGTILILIQEHFGIIKLGGGGNYIVDAYPVNLKISDLVLVFITVIIVSLPATIWPVKLYFSKKLKHILTIGMLISAVAVSGQVSYGGKPLPVGIEKKSSLRTSAEYVIELPAFNKDSVLEISDLPGNRIGGIEFAHKLFTNLSPKNSGLNFTTSDGTKVWKLIIKSEGAYSLNVLFDRFNIPDNARLFVYNNDRSTILGSFTNENCRDGKDFSISPVEGDEITIEYQEPFGAEFSGDLKISEVNHDYRGLFRNGTRFDQINLPCLPEVSCNSALDTISRSVCVLIINGNIYCTGVLINNTANNRKPYILTASHCIKNNPSLGSKVVAYLNYQSPGCDSRIRGSEEFSVSGSVTKAYSQEVDFALLELKQLPPAEYRPYLAGFSIDKTVKNQNPFVNIHHPYGEVKKYSLENDTLIKKDWMGNNGDGIVSGNHWNVRSWEKGHTWIGSSGSPIFDSKMHLRGCLTGGDSGGSTGCGPSNNGDFFFRLDRAWDQYQDSTKQLRYWLDPANKLTSGKLTINGFDPYAEEEVNRISNITEHDSVQKYYYNKPYSGALFGHNSTGIDEYAEHFTTTDSVMLKGVYLMVAKGMKTQTSQVKINVYSGGNKPGRIIATGSLEQNYIDYISSTETFATVNKTNYSNRENYFRLDKPVAVGNDFYVGYHINYPLVENTDSFIVYAAVRETIKKNTSWFRNKLIWFPFTSNFIRPSYASMWIEPLVMKDTITIKDTIYPETPDTLDINKPIMLYSPVELSLYIWLPTSWKGNYWAEIRDVSGRLCVRKELAPPYDKINICNKGNGVYIVRIYGSGKNYINKIIKF